MENKTINELRKVLKQFNIKQPRDCKKFHLIRLLKKEFIDNPKKRSEIKKIFDGLRFDKNYNDLKPREEKKIKTEVNLSVITISQSQN